MLPRRGVAQTRQTCPRGRRTVPRALTPGPADNAPLAVVVGTGGGIGGALLAELAARGRPALGLGRGTDPPLDLLDEGSIAAAVARVLALGRPVDLLLIATGVLSYSDAGPERSLRDLDPARLARAFAVNAIGPALLFKHFAPLLPRYERSVAATLSARVGSIGDNRLGGWHGYRASKAALNQLVRTASVELSRTRPGCVCVAVHPGTVDTPLSAPFAKAGLAVRPPAEAAARLLDLTDRLAPADTGRFLDVDGREILW